MNNIVTVIIPVFNAKNYLSKSIESVLNQSYKTLQIILIDDGSTDGSSEICDAYAKKDTRIEVVHQENKGSAYAKNVGLSLAKGDMLTFLDSDDFLEPDSYEFMVRQMKMFGADIIQCNFRKIYKNFIKNQDNITGVHKFQCTEYLEKFTTDWTCGLLWDKLFKKRIFEGIYFEEKHKIDDEFFTYKGVMNSNLIVQLPKITYNYRQRQSGIMNSKENQEQIILDKLEYLNVRRKEICFKYPQLKNKFDIHYLNMLLILSKDMNITESILSLIRQRLIEYSSERPKSRITLGMKKHLIFFRYCPIKILLKVRKIKNEEKSNYLQYFE